jgi:hypothetical protein
LAVVAKEGPKAEEGVGRGPNALTSAEPAMAPVTIGPAMALSRWLPVVEVSGKRACKQRQNGPDRSLSAGQ